MENNNNKNQCSQVTEVYSRVVGFYRPIRQWNPGKQQEFKERQTYQAYAN
jgi:ribonucleoside-triphosphate reductase (formate)